MDICIANMNFFSYASFFILFLNVSEFSIKHFFLKILKL